jgi:hypothetical protein
MSTAPTQAPQVANPDQVLRGLHPLMRERCMGCAREVSRGLFRRFGAEVGALEEVRPRVLEGAWRDPGNTYAVRGEGST